MERTMSVEEKIRRAEEIYERRKRGVERPIATVNISEDKKDIKLLKKMIIQILVCVSIYLVIYTIQNSEYVFSKDFINKVNEVLSYDTNFVEIYNNIKNGLQNIFQKDIENTPEEGKEENVIDQTAIGGAEGDTGVNEKTVENAENTEEKPEELSQTDQDIINIKNTTSFIKPVEGVITSPFGQRDTATGTVPKNHTGTDIAANLGTKIKSATDGEVVLASEEGDYGKHLKIQIGEVSIIYAHCNNLYVNPAVDTLINHAIVRSYSPAKRGRYLYSDLNFHLLKLIVEQITGMRLDQYLRPLFAQMEMYNTGFKPLEWKDSTHIVPTENDLLMQRGPLRGYTWPGRTRY